MDIRLKKANSHEENQMVVDHKAPHKRLYCLVINSQSPGQRLIRKLYIVVLRSYISKSWGMRKCTNRILEGSLSAASKSMFSSRYSCCSIFRDRQGEDLRIFAPLQIQHVHINENRFAKC